MGLALTVSAEGAAAAPLDAGACDRLRTERQALTVLGVDTYFNKGAEWAKSNLTVADLNLVKRYLDVFEQIKFRCEKIAAIVETVEKDEDEEVEGIPPMPERNASRPVKAAAPAAPAATAAPATPAPAAAMPPVRESSHAAESNSTEIVKVPGKRPTNASAVQLGPRQDAPPR